MRELFVMLFGLSVVSLTQCENVNPKSDSIYIDYLTNKYLLTETEIWNDIASNVNIKDVIQKIHREHLELFNNLFLIEERSQERLLLIGKNLHDYMTTVNTKITLVKDNYLHDSGDPESLKKEIIDMATTNRNTALLESHFELAKDDYFGYVKMAADKQKCIKHGQTMESGNYQLFQCYNDLSKSQLGAYALVQLSQMFLAAYVEKSYIEKGKDLQKQFSEQMRKNQQHAKELMLLANRDVWKCDLSPQSYDDPKYQVMHFLEGFVENEANLNGNNDCTKSCPDYSSTKSYGCHEGTLCDKEPKNPKTRCNGTILNCDFIEGDMTVCFTESYSDRRYTNIVLGSGKQLGSDNCHRPTTSVTSWTRWFVQCSNCFCLCDEMSEKTDRYFSLKEVVSDTASNSIITGVGLFKVKGIFTWGIHQSEFLGNGRVNLTKPWHPFTLTEHFQPDGQVEGVDYHTLTNQNRAINLDTVTVPVGSVVTGVRFKVIQGILNIEVRATKFEFSTGMLYNDHKWICNGHENQLRAEISLKKSNIPTKATDYSVPNLEENKVVKFQPTGLYEDVAQTTIPFIDSQMVESFDREAPLSGVGIYFKGSPGFGGFIAPKVITYDMSSFIGK
ncbi:hypothetical protein Bhyg_04725 [Pseudolycoriella hygida]|uniref:Uncharacterized protein n=1 Tax=Pseudolycoriella hygida TaxID=35572 RepID=A0A9Q0NHA6_9DIPT|nr:hypothetical protein Bhyg_04725 [Pseudolycoriella hygida]